MKVKSDASGDAEAGVREESQKNASKRRTPEARAIRVPFLKCTGDAPQAVRW